MSELDDFLNDSHDEVDAFMGVKSMTCNGQTFNVVWNDYRAEQSGALGGIEEGANGTAVAQPSDVTSPRNMVGLRCTIGSESFRVLDVSVGDVAITFTVCDPNQSK